MDFDWTIPVAYDDDRKRRWHCAVRRRLKELAALLGLPPESYDLPALAARVREVLERRPLDPGR